MGFWITLLIQLAIAVVLTVIAVMLTPKPKTAKPPAAQDQEDPVADAGKPVPVVFGTMRVRGLNVIFPGNDKNKTEFTVNA